MDNGDKDERRSHMCGGEILRGQFQRICPAPKGTEKAQRGRYERVGCTSGRVAEFYTHMLIQYLL